MALRYLLDTNIISEPIRQKPNKLILNRLQAAHDTIAIATVTWHELLFGMYRLPQSRKRTIIDSYLSEQVATIPMLDFDRAAATWFAQERARLVAIGRPPTYADGQIAATAAANNLILVTRNVRDFNLFQGVTIENWFEE